MFESLEALGLSSYEAKALATLLRHGPRSGPDLSRETGIPFGRIYDTLQNLEQRGLVTPGTGRPRVFSCVPPAAVPGRLLAAHRRRLQEEDQAATQQTAKLEQALRGLSAKSAAPASALYGVRIGEDAARDFLVESTHQATKGICAYVAVEHLRNDDLALFEAFRQAVERGVPTRILLRKVDLDYLLSTPYVDDVLAALGPHLGSTVQVRLSPTDSPPFSVLDDDRVVLGIRNPLDPQSYFAVVHLEDRAFAQDLLGKFDTLWRKAKWDHPVTKALMSRPALRRLAVRARRSL